MRRAPAQLRATQAPRIVAMLIDARLLRHALPAQAPITPLAICRRIYAGRLFYLPTRRRRYAPRLMCRRDDFDYFHYAFVC